MRRRRPPVVPAPDARFSQGPAVIPGVPMSMGISRLIEAESMDDPSVASMLTEPGRKKDFVDWLRAVPPRSVSGLPRYMQAVYDERPDLQAMYPEVRSGELSRFAWWAHIAGRFEASTFRMFGHVVPVRRTLREGGRILGGTDVIGFFNAEHGIGEASRLLVEALRASDTKVLTIGYRNTESRQNVRFVTDEVGTYRTVIAAVNAELNRPVRDLFGQLFFKDTYVIGQWFWELETAPSWYADAYQYVDELWAPTKFIEEMLKREAPAEVPVRYMPLPLRKPRVVENATRSELGLDDRFMFLFTFDFMSVMKRKNPLGVVEAFKRAFRPGEGPMLVLKSINGETRPDGFAELQAACEGREDIVVMNRYLDSHLSAALMNLCDCYVSLHRSEGLGLTIAEAMLLGKPVIATGYSGNLDFMTEETSFMVPWERVPVGENAEAYDANATWAEPNLDVAAELMRLVYSRPSLAREVAERGKVDLESRFTPERTGARMKVRLEEIWEDLGGE